MNLREIEEESKH